MKSGIELIDDERERQKKVEGWTPEHDDEHEDDELARAAACYAMPRVKRYYRISDSAADVWGLLWPWADGWWKPSHDNRVRELVKAGALIAAEIDRLQRKASNTKLESTAARSGPSVDSKRMLGGE